MDYAQFGRQSDRVSRLAFGAMGLNFAFGKYQIEDLLDRLQDSIDYGINIIDTARLYGDSERIIGQFLRRRRGNPPFIATKASPQTPCSNSGWGIPNDLAVAYPHGSVTRNVEESLRQLGVETIDLVQLHQYWAQYQDGDWIDELARLRDKGHIRYIGVSITDHRHDQGISIIRSGAIDSVQTIINIFDPLALDSLIPACAENGVAVIARCVLDEGGLSGFLTPEAIFPPDDFRHDYFSHGPIDEYVRRVDALRRFIPEVAASLSELAIRFALSDPRVTTAAISMQQYDFLKENVAAVDKGPLPDRVFSEIRKYDRWLKNLYEPKYFPR